MSRGAEAAPAPASLRDRLFPRAPRSFRGLRAWQVGLRTMHIVAMGLVLGGVAFAAPQQALVLPVALTVASGLLLAALDLWKSGAYLYQGNGLALLLKLALLGLGQWFPAARLEWYLAATAVASIGAHMPKTWRHWSLLADRGTQAR